MDYIEKNIEGVRSRVMAAAVRSGRKASDITVIAVSKYVPAEKVQRAVDLGLNILAENRVQELVLKYDQIKGARWHIIGHLQTNKVKPVIGRVELIHSVDSLRLLEEIDRQAKRMNIRQDILLELNISSEESKYGLTTEEFHDIISKIDNYPSVRLRGIMTMAPNYEDKELCRPVFREAARLFRELQERHDNIDILSMGMSGDFETAIEEGATHVRIGRGIFQESEDITL